MFGWLNAASAFASCSKRAANFASATRSGASNFKATIDGQKWAVDAVTTLVIVSATSPESLTITGTRIGAGGSYVSMTLALGFIGGAKTYSLGVNQGSNAGGSAQILDQVGGTVGIWMTDFPGRAERSRSPA